MFLNEDRYRRIMSIALDGLIPDAERFWSLCASKYPQYAHDAIDSVFKNRDKFKEEREYNALSDKADWILSHWEEITIQHIQKDNEMIPSRKYPMSKVIDDSSNFFEDSDPTCWAEYDLEANEKHTIRNCLFSLLSFSYYSVWCGKREMNNINNLYMYEEHGWKTTQRNHMTGFDPYSKWKNSHWSSVAITMSKANTTKPSTENPDTIPINFTPLIENGFFYKENNLLIVNSKEYKSTRHCFKEIQEFYRTNNKLVKPEAEACHRYVRWKKTDGSLKDYPLKTMQIYLSADLA